MKSLDRCLACFPWSALSFAALPAELEALSSGERTALAQTLWSGSQRVGLAAPETAGPNPLALATAARTARSLERRRLSRWPLAGGRLRKEIRGTVDKAQDGHGMNGGQTAKARVLSLLAKNHFRSGAASCLRMLRSLIRDGGRSTPTSPA